VLEQNTADSRLGHRFVRFAEALLDPNGESIDGVVTTGARFHELEGVHLLQGEELIAIYEAPILESPPAYRTSFCRRCGSPVPDPSPGQRGWFKIDGGTLDDDLGIRPQRHIHADLKAPWFEISDDLPRFANRAHIELRRAFRTSSDV